MCKFTPKLIKLLENIGTCHMFQYIYKLIYNITYYITYSTTFSIFKSI